MNHTNETNLKEQKYKSKTKRTTKNESEFK